MTGMSSKIQNLLAENDKIKEELYNLSVNHMEIIEKQKRLITDLENRCLDLEQKIHSIETIPEPENTPPYQNLKTSFWQTVLYKLMNYFAIPIVMVLFMILEPLKGAINLFVRLFFWQITNNKEGRRKNDGISANLVSKNSVNRNKIKTG